MMGVKEVTKPAYTHCTHECDKGCAIYATRPESCAGYSCLWLLEADPEAKAPVRFLREEERPDKSGVMFELSATGGESAFEKASGFPFFIAKEVRPGAFDDYWARKILKRLTVKSLVVLAYQDGRRRALGPPEKVREVGKFLHKVRVIEK